MIDNNESVVTTGTAENKDDDNDNGENSCEPMMNVRQVYSLGAAVCPKGSFSDKANILFTELAKKGYSDREILDIIDKGDFMENFEEYLKCEPKHQE